MTLEIQILAWVRHTHVFSICQWILDILPEHVNNYTTDAA
jgi:hypothetical protein